MHVFGCLGIIVLSIFIIIFALLRNIYIAAFGKQRDNYNHRTRNDQFDADYNKQSDTKNKYTRRNRKSGDNRVFPDNVGEYVDYEEVKD